MVADSCIDFEGRTASGFRPKLHSRAESLSLENLEMSLAVGSESLEIPKFGRENLEMGHESPDISKFVCESLDMGRESLCPDFRDQILVCPDFRDPRHDSCPDFPDLLPRLSRLKPSARLCNLGLNPDAARPLARLMSRLSRPYVQTFQIQTLGATMQFGSDSGCGATLGATHVQTFQTLCPDFPDANTRRDYAVWV